MDPQIIVIGISRQGTFKEMINLFMEIEKIMRKIDKSYKTFIKIVTYKRNQMSILELKIMYLI